MYLHIGQSVMIPYRRILGIFDLDNTSWSHRTRLFLEKAEEEGRVVSACDDLPRSFLLCDTEWDSATVYLSHYSAQTLQRRMEHNHIDDKSPFLRNNL